MAIYCILPYMYVHDVMLRLGRLGRCQVSLRNAHTLPVIVVKVAFRSLWKCLANFGDCFIRVFLHRLRIILFVSHVKTTGAWEENMACGSVLRGRLPVAVDSLIRMNPLLAATRCQSTAGQTTLSAEKRELIANGPGLGHFVRQHTYPEQPEHLRRKKGERQR